MSPRPLIAMDPFWAINGYRHLSVKTILVILSPHLSDLVFLEM